MRASDQPGTVVARSYQIIGRPARDRAGHPLGRVVDLLIDAPPGRPARVTAVTVTTGPWGRLLGYESPDERGPWLLSRLAGWVVRRRLRRLAWADVDIDAGPARSRYDRG